MKSAQNPVQSLVHFSEALVTQDKCYGIQLWTVANKTYKCDRQVDTKCSSFCRLEADVEKNLLIVPRNENSVEVWAGSTLDLIQALEPVACDAASKEQPGTINALKLIEIDQKKYVLGAFEAGILALWSVETGKLCHQERLLVPESYPTALDYDPMMNRGVIGSSSDRIGVFSIDRNHMRLIPKSEIVLKNPGVNRIAIRQDRRVFATAGWDGKVRLFSWKSLRPLAVLTEHKKNVMDLTYSPTPLWTTTLLASAGEDGLIALWDLYN